jgi:hypothetical protein
MAQPMTDNPLSGIPAPEVIRDRIAQIARERALLVGLLRLSKRKHLAGPDRQAICQEGPRAE